MITLIFIIITFVIIILGGYLFLVGQDGKIPYADMLVCVIGIFLSIYLAIQSAAGNVGDIVALEVNQTLEYVPHTDDRRDSIISIHPVYYLVYWVSGIWYYSDH